MAAYPPLISTERAAQNRQLSSLNTSNPAYLSSLIQAATDSVRRYCAGRIFNLSSFTEYYSVGIRKTETPLVLLRQIPIKSISRVGLMSRALQIQNSNTTVYSRANVSTTDLGLVITTVASGTTATINLYYGTYPTIAQLAAAINGLGNGWSASVQSGQTGSFNTWSSADLKPVQGAVSTFLGGAYLELPQDAAITSCGPWGFEGDNQYQGSWTMSGPGWRLDPETGEMWFVTRRGALNLRVDYIAGFDEVPESVQEATVLTAVSTWRAGLINPAIKSEHSSDYGYEINDKLTAIPKAAMDLLAPYRDFAMYSTRGSG